MSELVGLGALARTPAARPCFDRTASNPILGKAAYLRFTARPHCKKRNTFRGRVTERQVEIAWRTARSD
jgi:hypothetical protein